MNDKKHNQARPIDRVVITSEMRAAAETPFTVYPCATDATGEDFKDLSHIPALSCIAALANAGVLPSAQDLDRLNKEIADKRAEFKEIERQLQPAIRAARAAAERSLSPEAEDINAADVRRVEHELAALRAKCERDVKELEQIAWVIRDLVPGAKNPLKNSIELHDEMKQALVRWLVLTLADEIDPMALKPKCEAILRKYLFPQHYRSHAAIKQAVYRVTKAAGIKLPRGRKPRISTKASGRNIIPPR